MRKRLSFEVWRKRFALPITADARKIVERWGLMGAPVDELRWLAWIYSCAPSKKEMWSTSIASGREMVKLERAAQNAATKIDGFNKKPIVERLLKTFGSGVLPRFALRAGLDLRFMPRLFVVLPDVLIYYAKTVRAIAAMETGIVASRARLRIRVLVLLHCITKEHSGNRSPFRELATVLGAALWAAGEQEKVVIERNLQARVTRFKSDFPHEYSTLEHLSGLPSDDTLDWFPLATFYLLSKRLLKFRS